MATITKKAAKRISELFSDISLYHTAAELSVGDGSGDYWRYSLKEGLAVRALFDEFGIEAPNLSWFTEDRIEGLKICVQAINNSLRRISRQNGRLNHRLRVCQFNTGTDEAIRPKPKQKRITP